VAAIIVMKMRNLMLHPWAIWTRIHTRATNISSRLAIASLTTRAQAAFSRAKTAAHSSIATPWRGGAATSAISPRAERIDLPSSFMGWTAAQSWAVASTTSDWLATVILSRTAAPSLW
jgi:hypothetical protein